MNRENQSKEEIAVAKQFLEKIGINEEPTPSNPPGPDVIFEFQSKRIGIELTEFMYQNVRQQASHEREFQKLLKPIADELNISITPMFGNRNILKSEFPSLINNIRSYIVDWLNEGSPAYDMIGDAERMHRHGLDQYFYRLNIHEGIGPFIGSSHGAWARHWESEVEVIKNIIDGKDGNYPGYIQECDECWLLIHHSGMWWSPMEPLPKFPPTLDKETLFTKVFLFDCSTNECVEVFIQSTINQP